MTQETSPTNPNHPENLPPQVASPLSAENGHDSDTNPKLHEGLLRLGESVGAVINTVGAEGVPKYLHELLESGTDSTPTSEQYAAYSLIGQVEKNRHGAAILKAGEEMADTTAIHLESAHRKLGPSIEHMGRQVPSLTSMYDQLLGNPIRQGRGDTRRILGASEEMAQIVRGVGRSADEHVQKFKTSIRPIEDTLVKYGEQHAMASRMVAKIDKGEKTYASDDTIDRSEANSLLTDDAYKVVAEKIIGALEAASLDEAGPYEAMLAVSEALKPDKKDIQLSRVYYQFADAFGKGLLDTKRKVVSDLAEVPDRARHFVRNGEDRFASARHPDDLVEASRYQERALADIVNITGYALKAETDFFRIARRETADLRGSGDRR